MLGSGIICDSFIFVSNFEFSGTVILLVLDMHMNIVKDKTITVKHSGPVGGEHSFFFFLRIQYRPILTFEKKMNACICFGLKIKSMTFFFFGAAF